VRSGEIDAMVDDEPAFGAQLASGEYRIAHVAPTQNPWGAACRLGDRQMVALLDDGLGRAIASGALAEEWRRWFGEKPVPDVIAPPG
jgi:ABC-type amino acid transport substrate-binding protein